MKSPLVHSPEDPSALTLKQRATRGGFWSVLSNFLGTGINLVVLALLARLLTPADFGVLAIALLLVNFFEVIANQGLGDALIQRKNIESEHLDVVFWAILLVAAVMVSAVFLFGGVLASLFAAPLLPSVANGLAFSFLLRSAGVVHSTLLRKKMDIRTLAMLKLWAELAGGAVGVGMALLNFGVWSLVGQHIVMALVTTVLLWISHPWRPRFSFSGAHFLELLPFGSSVLGIQILNFASQRLDQFLIGFLLGLDALGFYSVGKRILLMIARLIFGSLRNISYPLLSEIQEEASRSSRVMTELIHLCCLVAYPIFIGLFVLAPEFVVVCLGDKWIPSIVVLRIMTCLGLLLAVFNITDTVKMAQGKPGYVLRINMLGILCYFGLFSLLVPWGLTGVALAFVLRGCILCPVRLWVLARVLPVNWSAFLAAVIRPLIATLLMGILLWFGLPVIRSWTAISAVVLGVGVVSGVGIYLVAVHLLDRNFIRRVQVNLLATYRKN